MNNYQPDGTEAEQQSCTRFRCRDDGTGDGRSLNVAHMIVVNKEATAEDAEIATVDAECEVEELDRIEIDRDDVIHGWWEADGIEWQAKGLADSEEIQWNPK